MPRREQSGSNQHPTQDKENVPPFRPKPKKNSVELLGASQSLRKEVNGNIGRSHGCN
jgi:hypothetical protein